MNFYFLIGIYIGTFALTTLGCICAYDWYIKRNEDKTYYGSMLKLINEKLCKIEKKICEEPVKEPAKKTKIRNIKRNER